MKCAWYTAVAAGCIFCCTGCTFRIQLVPPPAEMVGVEDTDARERLNDLVICESPAVRECIDAQELSRKVH